MFRGSAPAKVDNKGRIKVPTIFLGNLEERYGRDLFVTSVLGDSALIYPLAVWEELEQRLLAKPSMNRTISRYLERVNYFGQQLSLDAQGRVLVPQILRDKADIQGDAVVSGQLDHLVIWNRELFENRLEERPFTEDDFRVLSELEI